MVLLAIADDLSLDWATTSLDFDWKLLADQVKKLAGKGPAYESRLSWSGTN